MMTNILIAALDFRIKTGVCDCWTDVKDIDSQKYFNCTLCHRGQSQTLPLWSILCVGSNRKPPSHAPDLHAAAQGLLSREYTVGTQVHIIREGEKNQGPSTFPSHICLCIPLLGMSLPTFFSFAG